MPCATRYASVSILRGSVSALVASPAPSGSVVDDARSRAPDTPSGSRMSARARPSASRPPDRVRPRASGLVGPAMTRGFRVTLLQVSVSQFRDAVAIVQRTCTQRHGHARSTPTATGWSSARAAYAQDCSAGRTRRAGLCQAGGSTPIWPGAASRCYGTPGSPSIPPPARRGSARKRGLGTSDRLVPPALVAPTLYGGYHPVPVACVRRVGCRRWPRPRRAANRSRR
jgi:hypothetical protein